MRMGKAKPLPSVKSPKMGAAPVKKIKRMGTTAAPAGAGGNGMDDMARMMAAGGQL